MYIIVPSYPSIFFALDMFSKNKDVIVITSNNNVKLFLEEVGISVISYKSCPVSNCVC